MAGWLSRATSLFQQTPPPPEPFEVVCDCGGKVVGKRTSVYQKPACSLCERPVFVLPVNVYPRPKLKAKTKSSKSVDNTKTPRTPANVVVEDDPSVDSTKSSKRTNTVAGRTAPITDPSMLREPSAPIVTPLRLITVAIVLISAVTIGGLWYRQRIENAKATVAKAADEGMAALHVHDFVKAAQELERARMAVDVLGRTDLAANEIRRFSREATTLAKLVSSTLTEFLQDTLASGKPGQTEPLRLSSVDKGAWVIFDAQVLPTQGKDGCVIDAPVIINGGIVRIEIESSLLRKASQPDESGESPRLIFAAQLEELSALSGTPPTAVLMLNGKTAFLWTSYENYVATGYRPFDAESERQIRALLERQRETLQN